MGGIEKQAQASVQSILMFVFCIIGPSVAVKTVSDSRRPLFLLIFSLTLVPPYLIPNKSIS